MRMGGKQGAEQNESGVFLILQILGFSAVLGEKRPALGLPPALDRIPFCGHSSSSIETETACRLTRLLLTPGG